MVVGDLAGSGHTAHSLVSGPKIQHPRMLLVTPRLITTEIIIAIIMVPIKVVGNVGYTETLPLVKQLKHTCLYLDRISNVVLGKYGHGFYCE